MTYPSEDSIAHRLQRLENQSLALSSSLQRICAILQTILAKSGDRHASEIALIQRELQTLKTLSPPRRERHL